MASKSETVFGDAQQLAGDMKTAINDQDFSDIVFIVGDTKEKIHAHRVILSARCEVFKAMFAEQKAQQAKSGKKETPTLVLGDVRPAVFLTVLEFIYTNSCQLSQPFVVDVLASAIEYGLDSLAQCCCDYIKRHLTVDSACVAVQAAIAYGQDELKAACLKFIEDNTKAVFQSRHFAEMAADTFAVILQSDNLQIDEAELFDRVKEWGTINAVVMNQSAAEVLKGVVEHVRFPLLDEKTLQKVESENEKTHIVPDKLIAKAWKYQATKRADSSDPHFSPRAGTLKV
eukprot:m.10727 g.10727  ORF g.10727 m.10727 type:complete len:286 (-) comp5610_c0_seq1:418-1275(-)